MNKNKIISLKNNIDPCRPLYRITFCNLLKVFRAIAFYFFDSKIFINKRRWVGQMSFMFEKKLLSSSSYPICLPLKHLFCLKFLFCPPCVHIESARKKTIHFYRIKFFCLHRQSKHQFFYELFFHLIIVKIEHLL